MGEKENSTTIMKRKINSADRMRQTAPNISKNPNPNFNCKVTPSQLIVQVLHNSFDIEAHNYIR